MSGRHVEAGTVSLLPPSPRWRQICKASVITTGRALETRVGRALILAGAVIAASVAIYRERSTFVASIADMPVAAFVASLLAALLATGAICAVWRTVLIGLGGRMTWRHGARTYFVSQLGKYVPGSVWPMLVQMKLCAECGTSRTVALASNLISTFIACTVGLVAACMLAPSYDADALSNAWWVFLAAPFIAIALHPRVGPPLLNRLLRRVGREPFDARLSVRSAVIAVGWSLAFWIFLGLHILLLAYAAGGRGWLVAALCFAGPALAVPAGILAIPVPAGAGVRDAVLGLVLAQGLNAGQVLAIVVTSRVFLIICDLTCAGLAQATGRSSDAPRNANGNRLQVRQQG